MAVTYLFVAFVVTAISKVVVALHEPTGALTCSETGFSPVFTQKYDMRRIIDFQVKLGKGGPGCIVTKRILFRDLSTTRIDRTELGISGKNQEIPFKTNGKPTCGGVFDYNTDNKATIDYTVDAAVRLTETFRGTIKRSLKYEFKLKCHLTRAISAISGKASWKHASTLTRTGDVKEVSESFTLATSLKFYDSSFKHEKKSSFLLGNAEELYIRIAEDKPNPLFTFVVNQCWSTPDINPDYTVKDIFFTGGCPVDETVNFREPRQGLKSGDKYDLSMKSFFFAAEPDKAIYVHCSIYICKQGDTTPTCVQPSRKQCAINMKRRQRREVSLHPKIEQRTLSSEQRIILDNGDVYSLSCGPRYVYDRRNKECTKEDILEIKGIHLDTEWNPEYANTSSPLFLRMAREKSYQLYTLLQIAGIKRVIDGLKVIRAHEGGLRLDIQAKFAKESNAAEAASEFEYALRTTRIKNSRVIKILRIKQDEAIEYTPVVAMIQNDFNIMKIALIALGVIFLIIAVWGVVRFHRHSEKKIYLYQDKRLINNPEHL